MLQYKNPNFSSTKHTLRERKVPFMEWLQGEWVLPSDAPAARARHMIVMIVTLFAVLVLVAGAGVV